MGGFRAWSVELVEVGWRVGGGRGGENGRRRVTLALKLCLCSQRSTGRNVLLMF